MMDFGVVRHGRIKKQEVILLTDKMRQYGKVAGYVLALLIIMLFSETGHIRAEDNRTVGQTEAAQTPAGADGERLVSVDFNDVDLTVFVKFISEITGKNFVIDQQVKGKVTIISLEISWWKSGTTVYMTLSTASNV